MSASGPSGPLVLSNIKNIPSHMLKIFKLSLVHSSHDENLDFSTNFMI